MVNPQVQEAVQAYFEGRNAVGKSWAEIEDDLYAIKNFIEEKSSRTARPKAEN